MRRAKGSRMDRGRKEENMNSGKGDREESKNSGITGVEDKTEMGMEEQEEDHLKSAASPHSPRTQYLVFIAWLTKALRHKASGTPFLCLVF